MPDQTTETARALLHRHGLPEDVIDGVLCLHAQELAAVQRAAIAKTDDPVFYEGEAGWLVKVIEPETTPAAPLPLPADEARMRLLQALDASYCQALGHTPEGLLAAYEASRTQTVDRAALRERVATAISKWHRDPEQPLYEQGADAVLAVLPATTNHDTDTSAEPVCKDAEGCHRVVPCDPGCGTRDLLAEATRPMPAPVDRAAVLREAADRAEIVALRLRLKNDYGAANGAFEVMAELRRLAAECPECGTAGACNGGPCPLRRVADETAATETEVQR